LFDYAVVVTQELQFDAVEEALKEKKRLKLQVAELQEEHACAQQRAAAMAEEVCGRWSCVWPIGVY
jgi:hypothetical protein